MKKVKALLYCCKVKPYLKRYWFNGDNGCGYNYETSFCINEGWEEEINLNGTIPCECEIEVEDISKYQFAFKDSNFYDILKKSCLTVQQLQEYCPVKLYERKPFYALHISNLKVFDKPRELSDLRQEVSKTDLAISIANTTFGLQETNDEWIKVDTFLSILVKKINKAPQNMQRCYYYNKETGNWEMAILISIQPQWLCKILNGEKDIEIRKQVLNCMKE